MVNHGKTAVTANLDRGYMVQTIPLDEEFKLIKLLLPEVLVDTTVTGEHLEDIEHKI